MLNYAETECISPLVPVAPVPDTCSAEPPFISQMPKQVTFGHVTLTNDQEEFLQGFDAGMECYAELDYERQQMTAKELLHDLLETLRDDGESSLAWRLGLIAGEIAGMLTPDLAVTEGDSSFLEGLTRKCQVLYPGPGFVSPHLQAIHQATGLDLVDVEMVPSSPLHR